MPPLPVPPANTLSKPPPTGSLLRLVAAASASFGFALALRLSNLNQPVRVISFLLLPLDKAFDPSLAYLATGALPLASLLYRYVAHGEQRPRLGGEWKVPFGQAIDKWLVFGGVIFGIGWGLGGICRMLISL